MSSSLKLLAGLSASAITLAFAACSGSSTEPGAASPSTEASQSAAVAEPSSLEALSKDLSVQQIELAAVPSAPPVNARDLSLTLMLDRPTAEYRVGEAVRVTARPNKDAYLWIVNVHDDGKMEMLFPNKFDSDNLVRADTEIVLPTETSTYSFTVGGEPGADLVQAYATLTPEPPLPQLSKSSAAFSKGIGTFDVDAQAMAKDLSLVVEKVNCAVSKDLSITGSTEQPVGAAPAKPPVTQIRIDELCGAPASPASTSAGAQAVDDEPNWRDFGFASASAVFHIKH